MESNSEELVGLLAVAGLSLLPVFMLQPLPPAHVLPYRNMVSLRLATTGCVPTIVLGFDGPSAAPDASGPAGAGGPLPRAGSAGCSARSFQGPSRAT